MLCTDRFVSKLMIGESEMKLSPARKKSKYVPLLLFVCYSIVLFLFYSKYYFVDMFPMSGDVFTYFGNFIFQKNALTAGDFPLWNKWLSAGSPALFSLSPTILLNIFPLKFIGYAIYIVPVALGATFAYLYFKKIGCTDWASLAISICYLFSIHLGGLRKSHIVLVITISMLPLLLFLIEQYFSVRKLRWLLTTALVMGLQFYIGFPQQVIYTDLFLAAYLLTFGFHYRIEIKVMLRHGMVWIFTYLGIICFSLIPMLQQNIFYAAGGAVGSSYETFTSYSIHFVKLIQMIFPRFFNGDVYQAFGPYYSSEMDVEIFLGQMILISIFAGAFFLFRNFRVRFGIIAMGSTFLYAALGAVPPLAKVIYGIPILGDFRCAGRVLFLFIFSGFTLAALVLSEIERTIPYQKYFKFTVIAVGVVAVFVAVAAFSVIIVLGTSQGFTRDVFFAFTSYLKSTFLRNIAVMIVCVSCLALLWWKRERMKRYFLPVFCSVITVTVLFDTIPYTIVTSPCKIEDISEIPDDIISLRDVARDYKVWDALNIVDAGAGNIVSGNRSMAREIAALNAYIAMNNPFLYRMMTQHPTMPMNFSGLMSGTQNAEQILRMQQPFLSMMGVKYIIDSSSILNKGTESFDISFNGGITLVQRDSILLPASSNEVYGTDLHVESGEIALKKDTYYKIEFSCNSPCKQDFYCDFAAEGYDDEAQNLGFTIQPGDQHYSGIMNSGNPTVASNILWRVISQVDTELELRDFKIIELETRRIDDAYTFWDEIEGVEVYENSHAREVLYVPDKIVPIDKQDLLYQRTWEYQLDRFNYIVGQAPKTFHPKQVQITEVDFRTNSISAQISTDEDTFVNFSQCYYPGWNAYVDNKKTELYKVNGLIMGIDVPQGEHKIEFRFEPLAVLIGGIITGGTLIILIGAWILTYKKDKQ